MASARGASNAPPNAVSERLCWRIREKVPQACVGRLSCWTDFCVNAPEPSLVSQQLAPRALFVAELVRHRDLSFVDNNYDLLVFLRHRRFVYIYRKAGTVLSSDIPNHGGG